MQLAEFVAVSGRVRATRARGHKIALIADCLREAAPDELPVAVSYLAGRPRQGKVAIGWRTLGGLGVNPASTPSLELLDVDVTIDRLGRIAGAGAQAERREVLGDLLGAATADEQEFLRGLLLGELRQGALEGVVAQGLAAAWEIDEPIVRRALMLSGDLGAVAAAAAAGRADALRAFGLELFRPIQPMLASTAKSVEDAVDDLARCAVEAKLDGARVQVHRVGDDVRVYSRSLREMSAEVPAVAAAVRALPVERVILDGEALGVDVDGRPVAFQDTMRGLGGGMPFFFDCLHTDGADLLDRPLGERRAALERIVPADRLVRRWTVTGVAQARAAYAAALAAGHEGVVVKDLDAPYEAGRRGAAWRKVKPVHTFDLVVLGAEWGSGRRRGWLSNLHLGARDPDGGFVMLGKTFKGLTDEVLTWQTAKLLELSTRREGHVVHVRPELVVEIALDGLVRSPRYPGGVALRFARVVRYRDDKGAEEADTIETVRALHERRGG